MNKTTNSIVELKNQIKEKSLSNLYLFYGEEDFLKNLYKNQIQQAVSDGAFPEFNDIKITNDSHTLEDLESIFETYPMMSEKKFVFVKNSGIFKSSTESVKSFWAGVLASVPPYVTLVFDESEIDKRSSLYKLVIKHGIAVEFSYLKEYELVSWVQRECARSKKKIAKSTATYFVSICDSGLNDIKNELDKLISFCQDEILQSDIDRVVSKSLQVRIFEMTDSLMSAKKEHAFTILSGLKTVKESPFKILYLLSGTFDKMLHSKLLLLDGNSYEQIAKKIGVPIFIAKKYIAGAKEFDEKFLIDRVIKTAEIDFLIKQGKIDEWGAIEQYLAECIYYKK